MNYLRDNTGPLRGIGGHVLAWRVAKLEETLKRATDLNETASTKLHRGQPVSRAEAAAFLGVSTRKLQRMEAAGSLNRCPGLGLAVRYASRDVLRLASANGKER
ncbi:MAG: hypothetical protein U0704_16515 [Candidatus Eisenbacteria bacterium]